ncbi:MAG: hypothetical protein HY246_00115 [Proteobacteria bacterium]|nr:hypothetical protein [Pseudomonadota bacterium]
MNRIDEIVKDCMEIAESDYVGLWDVVSIIRDDLGLHDNELREKSLEVVRGLLERGLYPGDYLKTGFRFWEDMSIGRVLARIDREWKALGQDPDLAHTICWFDRRPSPRG